MVDSKRNLNEQVDGMPVRSESIGFSSGEMLVCGSCGKPNPPNRFQCFYCAAVLNLPNEVSDNLRISPREVESWEKGFNIVLIQASETLDLTTVSRVSASLSMDADRLDAALKFSSPTPIARVALENEAAEIKRRLESVGFQIAIVPDVELKADAPPIRLRAMEFLEDSLKLTAFNSLENYEHKYSDIVVIVTGMLIETKSESTFKRKRKETKNIEEQNTSADFGVADIYPAESPFGYRLSVNGFDFSCLGAEKTLFASKNLGNLVKKLRSLTQNARFISDYAEKQHLLDGVWELTRRNESKGVQRSGLGVVFSKGESLNNSEQFTKYSRLQKHLA